MKKIVPFLILCLLISCSNNNNEDADSHQTTMVKEKRISFALGISFPPVADAQQREFTSPLLHDLQVHLIRIGENWSFREPTEGDFNWSSLDDRMQWAQDNQYKILLTIQSNGPDWACSGQRNDNSCVYSNNEKFRHYIEQLLQRYPNKISKIQFGNEWQSDYWYVGNEKDFVAANNIVYTAIQEFSPQTQLVLGGFTTISLRVLAGCNGKIDTFYDDEGNLYTRKFLDDNCNGPEIQQVMQRIDYVLQNALYDLVDIHLYDDAENWKVYFENFKSMVQKPIIITEFGGPNVHLEPITEEHQQQRLLAYIETIDQLDVAEAYFFKLVEGTKNPAHAKSGLISSPELAKKSSYFTFKTISNPN